MCTYIAFIASVPFAMVFTNPRHSLYTMRHFTYLGGVSKNSLAVTVPYSLTLLSCSLVCFANHSSVKALFLICPFCLLTLSALPCCGLCTVCTLGILGHCMSTHCSVPTASLQLTTRAFNDSNYPRIFRVAIFGKPLTTRFQWRIAYFTARDPRVRSARGRVQ